MRQQDLKNYMLYMLCIHICWSYTCSQCKQRNSFYIHVGSTLWWEKSSNPYEYGLFHKRQSVQIILIIGLPLLCFFQLCTRDQRLHAMFTQSIVLIWSAASGMLYFRRVLGESWEILSRRKFLTLLNINWYLIALTKCLSSWPLTCMSTCVFFSSFFANILLHSQH